MWSFGAGMVGLRAGVVNGAAVWSGSILIAVSMSAHASETDKTFALEHVNLSFFPSSHGVEPCRQPLIAGASELLGVSAPSGTARIPAISVADYF